MPDDDIVHLNRERARRRSRQPPKPPQLRQVPQPRCSCCEKPAGQQRILLECEAPGRTIYLCSDCIALCNEILQKEGISTADDVVSQPDDSWRMLRARASITGMLNYCSLCGRERGQVRRLIAMPHNLFICNQCVGQYNALLPPSSEQGSSGEQEEDT